MAKHLVYNLHGQLFGRWTVLERAPGNKWLCRCRCGTEKKIYGGTLRSGLSTSCGCYNRAYQHAKRKDITGRRVGLLEVLEETMPGRWLCQCDCGNKIEAAHRSLLKAERRSCGCLKCSEDKSLHQSHHQLYGTWASMIQRCHNPKHISYKIYGARGIIVCDEWRGSFERFFADMGERPFGKTLDRINVNGPYRADNCKWSTLKEQIRNRRKRARLEDFSNDELAEEIARRKLVEDIQ